MIFSLYIYIDSYRNFGRNSDNTGAVYFRIIGVSLLMFAECMSQFRTGWTTLIYFEYHIAKYETYIRCLLISFAL